MASATDAPQPDTLRSDMPGPDGEATLVERAEGDGAAEGDGVAKGDGVAEGDGAAEGEEGASGGAFDPVTGKINWDCPCLGGMAYGPCGMQFREAFSCFVFSEQEPKGIDCIEKFKAMQDCFREHPDVYGDGT